jgi:D-serine dehydratase
MEPFLSGNYTVSDEELYRLLKELADTENINLEPSALAGMVGPVNVCKEDEYLQKQQLTETVKKGTHIVWGTGGSMVPEDVMNGYYKKGLELTI